MKVLSKKNFEKEIETIFGVLDFGETSPAKRSELLESASQLLEAIEANREILPYTYSTKVEIPRGSGKYSVGNWITSGFRINGETYSIEVGLDKCELTKRWQDEAGVIHEGEPEDVRHLKMIKIDNNNFFGDIKIFKRRKPTRLIRNLEQLKEFLSKTDLEVIQKVLG